MWDEIDARVAEREGLAKGEAFQRSVKARSAFGRAGVGHQTDSAAIANST